MERERDIVLFRIDRKAGILLLGALGVVCGGFTLAQQLTMSTSYPVPSGIYNQLVTTGNSGTVPADTTLNRNAGNAVLVPATNASGRVGIGTSAPAAKLDVSGTIRLGNAGLTQGGACSPEGILTYDYSGHIPLYCDNTGKFRTMTGGTTIGAAPFLAPYNGTHGTRGSEGWITGNPGSGFTGPGAVVASIGKGRNCLAALGSWGESDKSYWGAGCRYDPASGNIIASTIEMTIQSCIWICTN
ncbi:MAG: hypothetical protein ACHQ2Z_13780 [Elusimicrobiota bacterium]